MDALTDSGKTFCQYDPQNFWENVEASAKKWIFSPIWLLWSQNFDASKLAKDIKSMSKLKYSSRANQWCNRHVNMLKHIDLAELRISVGMIKWHFLVILVILGSKLGHFAFEILTKNPWDYKTRAQELTSGAIRMLLSFFVKIWEHFKDGRVWGLFYRINLGVKFDNFYIFWFFSALDGQIWIKLVTKLKIFWCSNWFW